MPDVENRSGSQYDFRIRVLCRSEAGVYRGKVHVVYEIQSMTAEFSNNHPASGDSEATRGR